MGIILAEDVLVKTLGLTLETVLAGDGLVLRLESGLVKVLGLGLTAGLAAGDLVLDGLGILVEGEEAFDLGVVERSLEVLADAAFGGLTGEKPAFCLLSLTGVEAALGSVIVP